MADDRRILTWSLNAGTAAYETDLKQYAHKIYSIGIHEFGVRATGKIYNYNTGVDYFDGAGNHNSGVYINQINETHCLKYPGIKFYLQTICFGWDKVKPLLESNAAQDKYIEEMGKVFDLYAMSRTTPAKPLHWEGIELDIEATLSDDTTILPYDEYYISFINKVKNNLCLPRQLKLRVNAFAQWGKLIPYYYRFHNYELFATATDMNGNASIDELQLMTYDFAWSGSAPGASTPTFWFREVGEWASKCFDKTKNPNAKLTMDKVFFGSAGYGNRWGLWEEGQSGRSITFRNLLGWQNGLYKHFDQQGDTYVYHDQEFIAQNGYEDPVSKNQVMLQHVYDFGNAKYGTVRKTNGENTAVKDAYNGKNYITTYSKVQQSYFYGVKHIAVEATISGMASPSLNKDGTQKTIKRTVNVGGYESVFKQYTCDKIRYVVNDTATACVLDTTTPEGQVIYDFNFGAGTYKVIALVSYPWYDTRKIGGDINGQSFSVGGDNLPDYYPFMFKDAHWVDMGFFNFTGSGDKITVRGELCDHGTPILGFVVCEAFDTNFKGGTVDFNVNAQPFKTKDGTTAAIPANYAVAVEILRQDARPVNIWEDRFLSYIEDDPSQTPLLEDTIYYKRKRDDYPTIGTTYDSVSKTCTGTYSDGFSYGSFEPMADKVTGEGYACFDYTSDGNRTHGDRNSGQLVFNHLFNGNVQVSADFTIEEGVNAGVRFGSQGAGDGFVFSINYATRKVELILEHPYPTVSTLATETLSSSVVINDRLTVKVIMHGGKGYFFMGKAGGLKAVFGGVPITLGRTAGGACGFYCSGSVKVRLHVLSISTTDRWDVMEKFEVEINNIKYPFGQIARPNYSYDQYGYLIYSGIDENFTRVPGTEKNGVSLDYEFHIFTIPGFQNGATLTIRFLDAGLWFANFYIGDAQGCSITYAGDAETFNTLLNIAVNDYGAKGIGLWVLGQEDPKLFELVPDVVPPYKK